MSENNERTSTFRQPFLAVMASLAAFMAIFGVKIPDPSMPKKASESSSESPVPVGAQENAFVEPSVVQPREWDDPITELGLLLTDQQKNPKCSETALREIQNGQNVEAIQQLLRSKLLPRVATKSSSQSQTPPDPPPRLLITLQIVSGPSHPKAKESRILWSHAFRMALSGAGFNKCDEQLVAALKCDLVTDLGTSKQITRSVVLPMKLFERSDPPDKDEDIDCEPDSNSKPQRKQQDYILNVWLMDDYLGETPWTCIQSVCSALEKVLGTSEDHSLLKHTKLAIVGPGGSDLLKQMDPTKSPGVGSFDPGVLSSDRLVWVNAHCTVPLCELWESPGQDSQAERSIDKGRVKIRYLESTPNDGVLIDLLAYELDQRLGSVIPVSKWGSNRILVFHEDDSEFGKNLIRSLEKKLCPRTGQPSKYSITGFPYLRGIGLTREPSGKSKESSKLTDVADYFRRTIDMYHEKSDQGDFYGNQPIAIGILGGENEDKIALLNQIRMRYPQSLVFTNDLNVQYLQPEYLPHTRNLLIAAHAGLNTTLDNRYEKRISFRDESQTTLWDGYKRLFDQTLGIGAVEGSQSNTDLAANVPSKVVPAYLFEVGNNQFLSILRSDELATSSPMPFAWVRECLAAALGCFTIWTLFTFPMLHALWPAHLRFGRRLLGWLDGHLLLPLATELSTRFGFPIEVWIQTRDRLLDSFKNAAVVLAVASLVAVCLLPLTASECTWVSDPSTGASWLSSIRNATLNRTMTWLTGVSVVPSVILLALCLPLTFWPAIKKDIERAFGLDASQIKATLGDTGKSMDQRVAAIRQKIERIDESCATPDQIALETPDDDAARVDPCNDQSIRDRMPVALAYLVCGAILSLIFSVDDPWMIQMTLLAVVTSLTSSCPTVRLAVLISFIVGVAITFVGWLFDDIPYVPARDPWIRAVASCAFAVAYWWLLIGLVKLFIHQRNLRKLLRHGTRAIERFCDHRIDMDRRVDSERRLKLADDAMSETQSVSRIISRDLSQLTFVGLMVCLARMPWFDAWGMSLATWLTIVLPMAAPFVSSIFLRRRGFEFRDACLRYQSELAFHASTHGSNTESPLDAKTAEAEKKGLEEFGKRLSGWQARFKSYDRGLFSPLDKDPMISTGLSLLLAFFSGPQGDLFKRIASFLLI